MLLENKLSKSLKELVEIKNKPPELKITEKIVQVKDESRYTSLRCNFRFY